MGEFPLALEVRPALQKWHLVNLEKEQRRAALTRRKQEKKRGSLGMGPVPLGYKMQSHRDPGTVAQDQHPTPLRV